MQRLRIINTFYNLESLLESKPKAGICLLNIDPLISKLNIFLF